MTIKHLYPDSRPTLDLKFAKDKTLDPRITFTRASSGTYVDENGVIQSAASGVARFDHDPVTNESLGLLVEEARTNLIPRSEELSVGWTAVNATAIDYSALSPENEFNGASLTEDSASSSHAVTRRITGITHDATYTASVYLKANGRSTAQFWIDYAYTPPSYMNIDLSNGTYTALGGTATTSLVSYGNGWYRASISLTNTAPGNFIDIKVFLTDASFNSTYQGDGTSGIYIWGAQLEAGTFPTSYIPTPAIFTSRASTATYYDANGIIQTAAIDVARDNAYFPDENGVMQPAGLLLEAAGTNLMSYSEDFSTGWSTIRATITAGSGVSPDGTNSASLFESTTTSTASISQTISTSGNATLSVYAKAGTSSQLIVYLNGATAWFDLLAGTVGTTNDGTASVIKIANGWYRCSLTSTLATTQVKRFYVGGAGDGDYSNTIGANLLVWGAQLEESPYPTSYIPTSGSTVTRAADISTSSQVQRTADIVTVPNTGYYDIYDYTIINQPFGVAGGSNTLNIVGPYAKRTTVFPDELTQPIIRSLAGQTDEFWRWRVTGGSFGLPNFTTDGQVTVDWGDGTVETLTTSDHTFTDGKTYHEIGFRLDSGTYFRPSISNNASHDTKVVAVGPAPESMKLNATNAFYGCSSLKAFDATVDTSSIINFLNAWQECSSLTSFPLIDTSSGIDFTSAWLNCTSLTSFPLIDTSSGISFQSAWRNCSSLTSFPLIDTSSGTNFVNAWYGCNSLTSFPLIDTSSGTNFNGTWTTCSSLTSFPLIDTSSGTNFSSAWTTCSSLTSFPLINTSSGTNFQNAWYNCNSLTSFPLIDTSSGTSFSSAWYNCNSLTSFPLIDTSSGTNFNTTWRGCSSLTSFPLIDTSSGTNFAYAWYLCSSLTSFPLIDTSSGTNFNSAWRSCFSLTSFPLLDTSSGTNFTLAWYNCSSLTSFPLIDTSSGTTFNQAWQNCSSLTSFPSNFFDSWTGTPANDCFVNTWLGCSSLTATSVENILNSIDTSGQSAPASGVDITIDYNAGSGTPNISTAVTNLKSRGWTITLNGVAQ
jgi:hypothetical protein